MPMSVGNVRAASLRVASLRVTNFQDHIIFSQKCLQEMQAAHLPRV